MLLWATILVLLAGGAIAWLAEAWNKDLPRWVSVGSIVIAGLLMVPLFVSTPQTVLLADTESEWLAVSSSTWIPRFGITLLVGIDGLSLLMVALTLLLGVVAVASSWSEIDYRPGFFQFNLMWTLAGVVGVFVALDLFLFFLFWEVMLIPMYFLIAIWGHEERGYAAMKFFLFTQVSGLLMLVSIVALVLVHHSNSGVLTFNYFDLLGIPISEGVAFYLMLGFFIAFVVKLPGFPFHTWLPDAHTQAPTAASVLLAGILLKTGAYGLIRFTVPLFPGAAIEIAQFAMVLGVVGIIYGAILAFAQTDFKRLVAYSSVSHMGFVLLGVYAWNELTLQGSVMQMVAHGLSTAALFMLAGALQHRLHTRDMSKMGGLWQDMPRMGAIAMFFFVASLGMPGLGNFVGEFLVLLGAFKVNIVITVIASIGLISAAIYALIAMQKVFQGAPTAGRALNDLDTREVLVMVLMMLGLVGLGMYPQPVFDLVDPVLASLYEFSGAAEGTQGAWTGDGQ
ncbi:MAG: NADH-quinone oxidoreductase subunit M [Pseudomonadales bacterium]